VTADVLFRKDMSDADWDEIRQRQLQRFGLVHEWIALTGMHAGSKVLDVGPGPGVFTREYATTVGANGVVYAVEKAASAVDYVRRMLADLGIDNVVVLSSNGEDAIDIGDELDIVMLTDVLHHAEPPEALLRGVKASMHPGTALLIAEFDRDAEGLVGPPLDERLSAPRLEQMIEAEDLHIVGRGRQAHEHYYYKVTRKA